MLQIPLQPIPSQFVKSVLGGQNFQILVQHKTPGIFVDVNVNGEDIVSGVIARDNANLICKPYAGISGNLRFFDLQGSSDPEYSQLNSRFVLIYLSDDELPK